MLSSEKEVYSFTLDQLDEDGLKLDKLKAKWNSGQNSNIYYLEVPENIRIIRTKNDSDFVIENTENTILFSSAYYRFRNDKYYIDIDPLVNPAPTRTTDPCEKLFTFMTKSYT